MSLQGECKQTVNFKACLNLGEIILWNKQIYITRSSQHNIKYNKDWLSI